MSVEYADRAKSSSATGDYETLAFEVTDHIALITIDSPTNKNGFNGTMRNELIAAAQRADSDDDVRVVVLTGKGRFFCPGADLTSGGTTFDYESENNVESDQAEPVQLVDGFRRDGGGQVSLAFAALRKPIITAYNGAAVGVGATFTLPTDIRIASSEAKFGFVFVRRGLVPEAASSWFLPRIVGVSRALDWSYTGRVFGVDEALAAGLISRIVEPENLLDTALEMARDIVANASAVSLGATRQLLWGMLTADSPWEAHRVDSRTVYELGQQSDVAEGVESFLEKRAASFSLTVPQDYPDFIPSFPDKDRID
ncbi:enoyl-CoA hydratase-related protein [Brevibacterium jeotgali]|uniref:Enoyl-CoA hydratase/carnithine racemase n=1 Tax=Brevibacterium jeotgali TaxID=1262550 RepID=A0A2H1L6T4_9MICO|nr:enoyl-CoA hydratase-related protein [Brevibacterium jeotgali]TWC02324.1 enoyl-CoA hydratase [Brevibacterium jeotgali]SMY12624.1 Enoyl-CoA hydratase/carnithine racemase [Brevibacterium jeotgali]